MKYLYNYKPTKHELWLTSYVDRITCTGTGTSTCTGEYNNNNLLSMRDSFEYFYSFLQSIVHVEAVLVFIRVLLLYFLEALRLANTRTVQVHDWQSVALARTSNVTL